MLVIIVCIVGYLLFENNENISAEDGTVFPWSGGSWKVDLIANYESGATRSLTNPSGGDIQYDNDPVVSLTYTLSASADTPVGSESYNYVNIDLSSFRLHQVIEEGWSPYVEISDDFSSWGPSLNSIPVDETFHEVQSWTWDFDDEIIGNGEPGNYDLIINPLGTVEYCGSDDGVNCDGETIEAIGLPGVIAYTVQYTLEQTVTIQWQRSVTWS